MRPTPTQRRLGYGALIGLFLAIGSSPAPATAGPRGSGQQGSGDAHGSSGPGRMGHHRGPDMAGMDVRHMLRGLDLTEQQQQTAKAIFERSREQGRALHEKIAATRQTLHAAMSSEVVDEAAIRDAATTLGALQGDQFVQMAYVRAELLAVLTPEQRAKLDERRAERAERREEFMERRQEWRDRRHDVVTDDSVDTEDGSF